MCIRDSCETSLLNGVLERKVELKQSILKINKTKRLPPLGWVPSYDLDMLTGDFIAGVTTALTVIPQGIGGSVWHCKYWE